MNGQAKAANKVILNEHKKKLGKAKGLCPPFLLSNPINLIVATIA